MKTGIIISLWNPLNSRFIKMHGDNRMGVSPEHENHMLPTVWDSERFLVVDAGYDKIALWNPTHKRFIKMSHSGEMTVSFISDNGDLPY